MFVKNNLKTMLMKTKFIVFSVLLSLFVTSNVTAQEKKFKKTIKINGRIQYDYEFFTREKSDEKFNGFEFRRLHLSASGKVAPKLKYKVEANFAHGKIGFRDVYIKYTAGNLGNFAVGSIAEPTGLDMATSSKYIPFFERAMLTSMQNFRWGNGLHYENFGLLDGKATLQMALTNNGSNSEGFLDKNLEKGNNFVGRITSAPIFDKKNAKLLHIGINYASRPYKDLKFRPENHMGGKYTYALDDANGRSSLGFELGTTFGPISVQGEYKTQTMDSDTQDYNMTSYYAFASYFLTGEHRPYKHASFGRVKPKNDIDNGGLGAIELLVRYSNMSASDDIVAANVGQPESINNISIGANWYLNSHARFMYNYVLTDDGNESLGNLTGHLFRFQLDF
jgi:phosphate-selective porin OprO/OprP